MTLGTTITNRWLTARRSLATGILSSGSVLGQMVFLPALPWTITRYDWRLALVSLALTALAVSPPDLPCATTPPTSDNALTAATPSFRPPHLFSEPPAAP